MPNKQRHDEDGSVSLELAVIFPAVLLLIIAAVQAGLLFHARHLAQAAAQEGLRATRQYDGTTTTGQQAAAGLLTQSAGDLLARSACNATVSKPMSASPATPSHCCPA
jgi:Flp pilus assembly protein TadG